MDTHFRTTVAGIPCWCSVSHYQPSSPMRVTGSGFGDAEPGDEEEFEFEIRDQKGYPAPWIERKMTARDHARLLAEFKELLNEDDEP